MTIIVFKQKSFSLVFYAKKAHYYSISPNRHSTYNLSIKGFRAVDKLTSTKEAYLSMGTITCADSALDRSLKIQP